MFNFFKKLTVVFQSFQLCSSFSQLTCFVVYYVIFILFLLTVISIVIVPHKVCLNLSTHLPTPLLSIHADMSHTSFLQDHFISSSTPALACCSVSVATGTNSQVNLYTISILPSFLKGSFSQDSVLDCL